MGLIHLEPAVLRKSADKLEFATDQLESVNRMIKAVAPDIESSWQSEFTLGYLERLEAVRQRALLIKRDLEHVRNSLQSTAERVERAEREAQQAVNHI